LIDWLQCLLRSVIEWGSSYCFFFFFLSSWILFLLILTLSIDDEFRVFCFVCFCLLNRYDVICDFNHLNTVSVFMLRIVYCLSSFKSLWIIISVFVLSLFCGENPFAIDNPQCVAILPNLRLYVNVPWNYRLLYTVHGTEWMIYWGDLNTPLLLKPIFLFEMKWIEILYEWITVCFPIFFFILLSMDSISDCHWGWPLCMDWRWSDYEYDGCCWLIIVYVPIYDVELNERRTIYGHSEPMIL